MMAAPNKYTKSLNQERKTLTVEGVINEGYFQFDYFQSDYFQTGGLFVSGNTASATVSLLNNLTTRMLD